MSDTPRFRVENKSGRPKVFLQCSTCEKDIKEIKPLQTVQVTRAYYCDNCDPGVIVLNLPKEKEESDEV